MTNKLPLPELKFQWDQWNMRILNGHHDEDPQGWLTEVEIGCDERGIPVPQRMLTAIHFLGGPLKAVMKWVKKYLKSRQDIPSCTEKWDKFKERLVYLHDYVKLAERRLLIGGSSVILPSLGVLAVNAAGFTSSGVAAGSLAATIQSLVYGASTGGLFSVFQSIGATAVVAPPVALILGGAAIGTGIGLAISRQGRVNNTGGGGGSNDGNDGSDGSDGDDHDEDDFKTCHCSSCSIEKNVGVP